MKLLALVTIISFFPNSCFASSTQSKMEIPIEHVSNEILYQIIHIEIDNLLVRMQENDW